MANVNPTQLEKFLKNIDYPTNKMEMLKFAEQQGIDKQICDLLMRLPEQMFERSSEVTRAISHLEHHSAR